MNRLNGRTILVGKEPGNGRLLVAIEGHNKAKTIGAAGSVPACVSRCKPADGIAHVKILIDSKGKLTIQNVKPQNVTYVNGSAIVSKQIDTSSDVALGMDRFSINVPQIMEAAKNLLPEAPKEYNIRHLERIWNDYQDGIREIRERQRKQNLWSRIPMAISMGGGLVTMLLSMVVDEEHKTLVGAIGGLFTFAGFAMLFYSMMKSKNDTSFDDQQALTDRFQDTYVCPNPKCRKFMGPNSYKFIKKQYSMKCPHCGSKFTE